MGNFFDTLWDATIGLASFGTLSSETLWEGESQIHKWGGVFEDMTDPFHRVEDGPNDETYNGGALGGDSSDTAEAVSATGETNEEETVGGETEQSTFENVGGEGSGSGESATTGASTAVRGTLAAQGAQTFGNNGGFGFTKTLGA